MGSKSDSFFCRNPLKKYIRENTDARYRKYKFLKENNHLLYSRDLHPWIRKLLNLIREFLVWCLKKRDENRDINRSILISMGFPKDTNVFSLDAFYKKEFRKKKYIYFFRSKGQKNLPEPKKFFLDFIPKDETIHKTNESQEFFKNFGT